MPVIAPIQFLRAIAALTVVVGHAQHDARVWSAKIGQDFALSGLLPWGAGVDLFFVISGFIMVYTSQSLFAVEGGARSFVSRRLLRIVPLYWIMAALYLATALISARATGKPLASFEHIVAAFAFFPTDTFADGIARPFYTLGWTLNYEMFFYLCFAVVIALPRNSAVRLLSIVLAVFVLTSDRLGFSSVALDFWSKPIILEFVLGMLVAQAMIAGLRLSPLLRLSLVAAAILMLHLDGMQSTVQSEAWITPNDMARVLFWGLPAFMLVLAATCGAQRSVSGPVARILVTAGDASYALYLSHPFVIVLVRKAMLATGLFQMAGGWALVALATLLALGLSIIIHKKLERPLTAALSRRFATTKPAVLSAQAA